MEANHEVRDFARSLRRRLSLPEGLLWRAIKGGKANGLKFRKQHPIGPYVLDCYCHEARLCVEIDGASHGFGYRPELDARGMTGSRRRAFAPSGFQPRWC
jgi:very-short-patch-repair endonuclease